MKKVIEKAAIVFGILTAITKNVRKSTVFSKESKNLYSVNCEETDSSMIFPLVGHE
jgi:hypothetical protein